MPKRIQLSRKKGYHKPADAVNVARPTKWGNPYRVINRGNDWWVEESLTSRVIPTLCRSKMEAAKKAVGLFRATLSEMTKQEVKAELRGKDLACWCGLCDEHKDGLPLGVKCDKCPPCHADVLLELANQEPAE